MSDPRGSDTISGLAARVATLDPEVLIDSLVAAGWTRAGGRDGIYSRLSWPAGVGSGASLFVPLNQAAPVHPRLVEAVLMTLEAAADLGRRAQAVLDTLDSLAGDPEGRTYLDNPPAAGAPAGWRWGYLGCGCCNDGYGRHLR